MRPPLVALRWTLVAVAAWAAPALAWQVHVGTGFGEDRAQAVAFLPRGDVVAGGLTERSGDQGVATVVRLTAGGRLAWKALLEPRGSQVKSIAADHHGDVVVGALLGGEDETDLGRFAAVKLDGRTGAERWRFGDSASRDGTIALDDQGDVVVGTVLEVDFEVERVCAKVDGRTGGEHWRRGGCGQHVAIIDGRDVVAAGGGTLRRLAGADGDELWSTMTHPAARLIRVAGDGVVAGGGAHVAAWDARDGAVRWQRTIDAFGENGIRDLAPDGGDVIVAGESAFVNDVGRDAVVARLAGDDGRMLWIRTLDGGDDLDLDAADAVGIGRGGDVIVAARLQEAASRRRLAVLALDGSTGTVRWMRYARGEGGIAAALATAPRGTVAIGGGMTSPRAGDDDVTSASFLVLRLAGRAIGPVRDR